MIYATTSSNTLLLLAVSMLIQTSAAVSSTVLPPQLTISKVQEAIQSASMADTSTIVVNPKLDSLLQYLMLSTTPATKDSSSDSIQGDPSATLVSKDSRIDSLIRINQKNEVMVDVLGKTSPETTLKSVLMKNGYQVINCYMNTTCSVYLNTDRINDMTKIPEIAKIKLEIPMLMRESMLDRKGAARHRVRRDLQGSVLSEAVSAMFVDEARSRFNDIDGKGITIGILSDSFNCNGTQAQIDVSTGDLPRLSRINVLADYYDDACTDEGRAMMQLVYDIAPGAKFAFHTAFRGEADFAAGIIALADAGCQIIVDDIRYFAEPFFQDGIIALAVNEVASRGVSYFSAAGNAANVAWDGTTGFVDSAVNAYNATGATFHSYGLDTNGSHIILQPFRTRKRSSNTFILQWDEPFTSPEGNGGSRSDVDIYVLDENGVVLSTPPDNNTGFDPVDFVFFDTMNVTAAENSTTVVVYVAIALNEGPPPTYMKIVSLRSGTFNFSTGSEATSYGHSNSISGAGVGAANYINTPAFGVSPPIIETFSSYGGVPILFDAKSNRLPVPEIRQQPRFTGPDGVSTTFFYGPNRTFFGTSASAPNVAAVAALMLQLQAKSSTRLTPAKLFQILESTAIDMTSTFGFDFITGYGFVNASSALDAVSLTITTCGLFGLNFFCPFSGECGFFRRLFNINGC